MLALALSQNTLVDLVTYLIPMILSLTVHEYAHAWAAFRLGDDTAARMGRLTLNPMAHIDLVGTVLIPAFNVMFGGIALIGWAKPVPVRPSQFNRSVSMRTGMILTSVAGPLSNLLLAIISIGLAAVLLRTAPSILFTDLHLDRPTGVIKLLQAMFTVNIGLFVFNMLPLPPLDGSRLLPRSMDKLVAAIAPYSFIVMLVVINVSVLRLNLLYRPVAWTATLLEALFNTPLWSLP